MFHCRLTIIGSFVSFINRMTFRSNYLLSVPLYPFIFFSQSHIVAFPCCDSFSFIVLRLLYLEMIFLQSFLLLLDQEKNKAVRANDLFVCFLIGSPICFPQSSALLFQWFQSQVESLNCFPQSPGWFEKGTIGKCCA